MKVAVLTTDTPHHRFFLRELAAFHPIEAVVLETEALQAPFETFHDFEKRRDEHEAQVWGELDPCETYGNQAHRFPSLNDPEAQKLFAELEFDLVLVFGPGKLAKETIANFSVLLNFHGGDPQRYRGLDSHLWAIYHGDLQALVATLHVLRPELDTGEIVLQDQLNLAELEGLHDLRRRTTECCVDMTRTLISGMVKGASVPQVPQRNKGRYYSFMPACLKAVCEKKFPKLVP